MVNIVLRTLIIYCVLILSLRLMGKRQIGELQVPEFIVTLLLSEIASGPITNRSTPVLHAVIPVFLLISLEMIVSFLLIKCHPLKRLFNGAPTILIRRGKLIQSEMQRNRIEIDELIAEVRQKGFADLSDVDYAILEDNGKLSVFPRPAAAPVTPRELSLTPEDNGRAHLLVVDGNIVKKNLRLIGWEEHRLFVELERQKTALSDVFLLTVDDAGHVNLIQKERKL